MSAASRTSGRLGACWESVTEPIIASNGFREYDARWRYPDDINMPGITEVGAGIGTQMREEGIEPNILVGCDFREYSLPVKNALIVGLIRSGARVKDIGVGLSPMAYFARVLYGVDAVAMVTASHNPNGWTGVKVGFKHPHTHGQAQMRRLGEIVMERRCRPATGGGYEQMHGLTEAYIDDICGDFELSDELAVVCATGNGTASAFAPMVLERIGARVVRLHAEPDFTFPNYNPNPESVAMLKDISEKVLDSGADVGFGFDGDGDRLGVVDDEGEEIYSDKIGVLLAREFAKEVERPKFVADVKSTCLFASDPVLAERGAVTEYWKTGHSHMKLRVAETRATAGFEKSGHFFLSGEFGHGYDCGLRAALEVCKMLDKTGGASLSDLKRSLPRTWQSPTMSAHCSDDSKYDVVERLDRRLESLKSRDGRIGGLPIIGSNRVNGIRVTLDNGSWCLVRASSNTPNLVVCCESTSSAEELNHIFKDFDELIKQEPEVGPYDQTIGT